MPENLARRAALLNGTREVRALDYDGGLIESAEARAVSTRAESDDQVTIAGYSSVFERWYKVRDWLGEYNEIVRSSAFDKTLKEGRDILGLFNHDVNYPLGRHAAGTLRSSADKTGLRYEIDVNRKSPAGQTVAVAVEDGNVRGASFAFETVRDRWTYDRDAEEEFRELLELRLFEHGPVTMPASDFTTAQAEAARSAEPDEGDVESIAIKIRRGAPLNYADVRLFNSRRADVLDALRALGLEPERRPATNPQPADELLARLAASQQRARLLRARS